MISLKDIEDSTPAFIAYMEEVDLRLRKAGVPIQGRPLVAFQEIAKDGIQLIIAGAVPTPHADRINNWFERRYGDRLKIDFSIGKAVILVRGDPYVARLPLIYGKWDGIIDVTKSFDGMTKELFADLPETARANMLNAFRWLYDRFSRMQSIPVEVLANLNTTVTQIMAQTPHYGEAKWAALQMAEKTLKEFIKLKGGKPPWTHDLTELLRKAEALGLPNGFWPVLSMIQCSASIRYEGEISLDEAVLAHHVAIDLCAHIAPHMVENPLKSPQPINMTEFVVSFGHAIVQNNTGGLLFKFILGNGDDTHLIFMAPLCIGLLKNLRSSMEQGRHKDERPGFNDRHIVPRHPIRTFLTNLPEITPAVFDEKAGFVTGYDAQDHGNAITFEFRISDGTKRRLILDSAVVNFFADYLQHGIEEGRKRGLFPE